MVLKRRKQEIRPGGWAAARSRNAPEAVLGDLSDHLVKDMRSIHGF